MLNSVSSVELSQDLTGLSQAESPAASEGQGENRFQKLKQELHDRLIHAMDMSVVASMSEDELREHIRTGVEDYCRTNPQVLLAGERHRLSDLSSARRKCFRTAGSDACA